MAPINFGGLLQPFLTAGATRLFGVTPSGLQLGGLTIPNAVAGLGLGAAGAAMNQEPGEVTQARQFLRNRFTSPTALSEQFAGQLGGLMSSYQPLLDQQRRRDIGDISQRFAAAFPSTVGAQGPEFGTLARYITDQALPREHAVLGDLGRQLLNEQGQAASTILNTSKPDPFAQALAQFGGLLTARDLLGMGGQAASGGSAFPTGNFPGAWGATGAGRGGVVPAGAPTQLGQLSPASLATQLLQRGDLQSLGGLMASGALQGLPFPTDVDVSTAAGHLIQQGINAGLVESPAAQSLGGLSTAGATGFDAGLPGAGLLGPAGLSGTGLVSSAASVLGSGAIGYAIGRQFNAGQATRAKAGLGGAAGGAATGFAVGGPVGGVIGAIVGGIAGIVGSSQAEHARKAAQTQAESQQTNALRPHAIESASQLQTAAHQADEALSDAQGNVYIPLLNQLFANGDPGMQQFMQEAERRLTGIHVTPGFDTALKGAAASGQRVDGPLIWNFLRGSFRSVSNSFQPQAVAADAAGFQSQEAGKFLPKVEVLNAHKAYFAQLQDFTSRLLSYLDSRRAG